MMRGSRLAVPCKADVLPSLLGLLARSNVIEDRDSCIVLVTGLLGLTNVSILMILTPKSVQ